MIVTGIARKNGDILDLDRLVIFLGYQMEHKITGRLLPHCTRFEIYTKNAMLNKILVVEEALMDDPDFDITDYELIPMYDIEFKSGWVQVTHENDW